MEQRYSYKFDSNFEWEKYTILFWICSKDGTDVVTAGVVGLAFVLIKAQQNTALNVMGIKFLEQFVKKRYIFGSGILKNLTEFLFADQEAPQYAGAHFHRTLKGQRHQS